MEGSCSYIRDALCVWNIPSGPLTKPLNPRIIPSSTPHYPEVTAGGLSALTGVKVRHIKGQGQTYKRSRSDVQKVKVKLRVSQGQT